MRAALRIYVEAHKEWVETNDLAELQPDGSFRWLGRWDTVINTGGVKVQVEQVESALEEALRTSTRSHVPGGR